MTRGLATTAVVLLVLTTHHDCEQIDGLKEARDTAQKAATQAAHNARLLEEINQRLNDH